MNDLRDFLNWFDGFAENIETAPTEKQWGKIKERIAGLQAASAEEWHIEKLALPGSRMELPKSVVPAPKPKPLPRFYVDEQGFARKGPSGQPITAGEVADTLVDLRGLTGDVATIVWADGSMGLGGHDLTIVAA